MAGNITENLKACLDDIDALLKETPSGTVQLPRDTLDEINACLRNVMEGAAAAQDALTESESRLRLIIENSPDRIFQQDENLRYTWYSGAPIQGMPFNREKQLAA